MKEFNLVLVNKIDEHLYVKLTKTTKGKPTWEYTEEFDEAFKFKDENDIDFRMEAHRIPRLVKSKPYENAFHEWMQRIRKNTPDLH